MYLPAQTIPFVMEVMPQVGQSESAPRFRPASWLPESWILERARRQIDRSRDGASFPSSGRSPLLGGAGWVVLPSDACRALGVLPLALRLLRSHREAGLAVSAGVRPWLPRLEGCDLLDLPDIDEDLPEWCRRTDAQRRPWSMELGFPLDRAALAGLSWLGGERRIVLGTASPAGVANIELPASEILRQAPRDDQVRDACVRLGLTVPGAEPVPRRAGKTLVFQLPDDIRKGRVARWCATISQLAADHSVVVAHARDLVPELSAALQGLGNRISVVRLQRAEDVLRLAADARAWIAPPGPVSVVASWVECPVVLFDRRFDPLAGYGPSGLPSPAFARFVESRLPSAPEVRAAVLDLSAHGM